MEEYKNKKSGLVLILGVIIIGVCYPLLNLIPISFNILDPISVVFNGILAGGLCFLILRDEFTEWFKHFNFKWTIIGIPLLVIVSLISSNAWKIISGDLPVANKINSVVTWIYVISHVPFLLIGEELLCIPLLYGGWKKLGMKFWQASLLCATLFAVWHLPSYGFRLLQVLITIIPARLVLNYLFKKTDSIWVTFIVHMAFDIFSFLPILLLK